MRVLYRFLRSKLLAAVLLILLILVAGLGNTVPQINRGNMDLGLWQAAHPNAARLLDLIDGFDVFHSVWFIGLLLLLSLNTLACSLGICFRLLRRRTQRTAPAGAVQNDGGLFVGDPDVLVARLESQLRRRGFSVDRSLLSPENGHVVHAEKYRLGEWMSVLFHLSLVFMLAFAAVNSLISWRGVLVVGEGETFAGTSAMMHAISGGRPARETTLPISLSRFHPRYKVRGFRAEPASELITDDGRRPVERLLTTGQNIRLGPVSVYQGYKYGVTFAWSADPGRGVAVPLKVTLPAQDVADQVITEAWLPGGQRVIMQPAFTSRVSQNTLPLAERFTMRVAPWRQSKRGDWMPEQPLRVGDSVKIGALTLRLTSLRYWSSYAIVSNPMLPLVFAFAWLGAAALAVGFCCYTRRLAFAVRPGAGGTAVTWNVAGGKNRGLIRHEGEAILKSVRDEEHE